MRVCDMTNCNIAKFFLNGRKVGEGKVMRNQAGGISKS